MQNYKKLKVATKFNRHNFLVGMGSIASMSGLYFLPMLYIGENADLRAIKSDWRCIGDDIMKSIVSYQRLTRPTIVLRLKNSKNIELTKISGTSKSSIYAIKYLLNQ